MQADNRNVRWRPATRRPRLRMHACTDVIPRSRIPVVWTEGFGWWGFGVTAPGRGKKFLHGPTTLEMPRREMSDRRQHRSGSRFARWTIQSENRQDRISISMDLVVRLSSTWIVQRPERDPQYRAVLLSSRGKSAKEPTMNACTKQPRGRQGR